MSKKYFIYAISFFVILLLSVNIYNLYSKNLETPTKKLGKSSLIAWGNPIRGQLGPIKKTDNITINNAHQIPITDYKSLSVGYNFFGIVDQDGKLSMQGDNRANQMGDGTKFVQQEALKLIKLPDIMELSSNQSHTLALNKNGEVFSWGLNLSGQLGDGKNENLIKPTQVSGLPKITNISAGYRTSFGIDESGRVYGWGGSCNQASINKWQSLAQDLGKNIAIGGGYYDRGGSTPDDAENLNDCNTISEVNMNLKSLTPMLIDGLANIREISSGYGHFLALDNDGAIWSWGCNLYGQLGRNSNANDPISQKPTKIEGIPKMRAISAGFRHSMGLDIYGKVWSWGHNEYGELGNNTKKDSYSPQKIETLEDVTTISASHDYSVAINQGGQLFGWGENLYSQLNRSKEIKTVLTPELITGLSEGQKVVNVYTKGTFVVAKIEQDVAL